LKTRRINFAQGDIKNVKQLLDKNGDKLLKQVSPKRLKLATESLARMKVHHWDFSSIPKGGLAI
jgi:hypothetical protein